MALKPIEMVLSITNYCGKFCMTEQLPDQLSFCNTAVWRTLQGFEVMNMIRKGQVQGVAKGDVRGQVALVTSDLAPV